MIHWVLLITLNFWHLGLLLNHWPTDPKTLATLGAAHWISPATILNLSVCRGFTPTSLLNLSLLDQTCESFPTYLLLSAHFWVSHTLWFSHPQAPSVVGPPHPRGSINTLDTLFLKSHSITILNFATHTSPVLAYIWPKWLVWSNYSYKSLQSLPGTWQKWSFVFWRFMQSKHSEKLA